MGARVLAEAAPTANGADVVAPDASTDPPAAALTPALAVAGLCGGAGASTLAYLVAHSVARASARPVLVCDTGGPSGGLAAYAGVDAPRSLAGVSDAIARGEPLAEGLFAETDSGLRVIARGPDLNSEGDGEAIARVLLDARGTHDLAVIDCGTLARAADRHALACATHVAWLLPATASGLRRGWRALAALAGDSKRHEIVVARSDPAGRPPPMGELGALAAERGAPLVLMPNVPDLAEEPPEAGAEAAGTTLQAIRGVLAR